MPNLMFVEYAWGEVDWRAELLDPSERIEHGHLVLPAGPGIGHRLNMDVAEAHCQPLASGAGSALVGSM